MTIKDGFDNKPTHIEVSSRTDLGRKAEVWIEQMGLPRYAVKKVNGDKVYERIAGNSETLAYATLDELLSLRDEINNVIQELVK